MEVMENTNSDECVRISYEEFSSPNREDSIEERNVIAIDGDTNEDATDPQSTSGKETRLNRKAKVKRHKEKKSILKLQQREQLESTRQPNSLVVTTTSFPTVDRTRGMHPLAMGSFADFNPPLIRATIHVKPLIVLDLNGILCHRIRENKQVSNSADSEVTASVLQGVTSQQDANATMHRPSVGRIANTEIIPRTDLHEFLDLLHNNFSLAVWTSATPKTAKLLVQLLFPPYIRDRLVFVWHRNICTLVENIKLEECLNESYGENAKAPKKKKRRKKWEPKEESVNNDSLAAAAIESKHPSRTIDQTSIAGMNFAMSKSEEGSNANKQLTHHDLTAIKSLCKVWQAYPLWDASNTLLLDDSPEKCPRQFRGNAIHPPPIRGTFSACSGVPADGKHSANDNRTITNDDDVNQNMQREFFALLANHWQTAPTNAKQSLCSFMERHSNGYNMGWKVG